MTEWRSPAMITDEIADKVGGLDPDQKKDVIDQLRETFGPSRGDNLGRLPAAPQVIGFGVKYARTRKNVEEARTWAAGRVERGEDVRLVHTDEEWLARFQPAHSNWIAVDVDRDGIPGPKQLMKDADVVAEVASRVSNGWMTVGHGA